jgi:hypothetical protein
MVAPRRGRPPVRCTEDSKCDAQTIDKAPSTGSSLGKRMAHHAGLPQTRTSAATAVNSTASVTVEHADWGTRRTETLKRTNVIFHELIELGWNAKRGWVDKGTAEITATRGIEMLYVTVQDGTATSRYSLWDFDKPAMNNKPESNLPFDPDEIGDGELARMLVGTKVTWYNRLSDRTETAVCGRNGVRIEHGYNVRGDEVPGERIIKFIDAKGHGFGAFRLDALIKVGR